MTLISNNQSTLPLIERLESSFSSVDVFKRFSSLPHIIFFDSAMRHPQLGRYSFVAADPVKWWTAPADGTNVLAQLASLTNQLPSTTRHNLPPFQGGWAGLFGYELASSLEHIPKARVDEFTLPALAVGLYDVVVAFDHLNNTAWLISQGLPESDEAAREARAADRLAQFKRQLYHTKPAASSCYRSQSKLSLDQLSPQFAIDGRSDLLSNFSADGYRHAVQQVIDYIHAGDAFQVNLSQRLLHAATSSSIDLYCRLRDRNSSPFAGYLDGTDWQVACASPERFIRVDGNKVETRPIKGTRRRSPYPVADMFTGDMLRASEKDRAENVMIVDLLRNDLSRTCRPDSVLVSQLCELETYEYVQHLVSGVVGTLRPDCLPLDAFFASFPGGSITGAPKIRAMEIIAELEPTARGPYCGSLGYIGVGRQMDTNILIRTITSASGWWQFPVGGGVVAQSSPQDEYEETWHKATGLLKSLRP